MNLQHCKKSITLTKEKHVASVVWQSTQYQIVQIFQPCEKKFRQTHTNLIALCGQNSSCSPPPQHSVIIRFNVPHDPPQHVYNLIPPSHQHPVIIQFDSSTTKHSVIIQFDSYHTIILELFNLISAPYQHSVFDSFITSLIHHTNTL